MFDGQLKSYITTYTWEILSLPQYFIILKESPIKYFQRWGVECELNLYFKDVGAKKKKRGFNKKYHICFCFHLNYFFHDNPAR